MIASDYEYVASFSHKGTPWISKARGTTLIGLIILAKREIFHQDDQKEKNPDKWGNESSLAAFLVDQLPVNQCPSAKAMIRAAKRCREWADFEEQVMKWAVAPPPAHYQPFRHKGMWRYSTPYGLSDEFRHEFDAELHAEKTRDEDELARETTERIRKSRNTQQEEAA